MSAVSGVVFNDANVNGRRDAGEAGAGGGVVYADLDYDNVLDANEPSIGVKADGTFQLAVGDRSFALRLRAATGQTLTTSAVQYFEWKNGALTGSGTTFGVTSGVVTSPGQRTISAYVYVDANRNGRRDPGEAGLQGRAVYADYDYDGTLDSDEPSRMTQSDGTATLTVDSRPFALRVDDRFNNEPSGTTVQYFTPTASGFQSSGNTFGYVFASTPIEFGVAIGLPDSIDVGGLDREEVYDRFFIDDYAIWVDQNRNGRRDANEPEFGKRFIIGVTADYPIRATLLVPGTYDIAFSPSHAVGATATLVKSVDVVDLSVDQWTNVTLAPLGPVVMGQFFNDRNADGIQSPFAFESGFSESSAQVVDGKSGLAWIDYDFDGILDADEPSTSPLMTSTLYNDVPGFYVLRPQAGRAFVVQATAQSAGFNSVAMRRTTPSPTFTLSANGLPARLDIGFNVSTALRLNTQAYLDSNENRQRDAGEAGVAGQTIFADYNYNGVLDAGEPAATTDTAGNASINVEAKPFALRITPTSGNTVSGTGVQYFTPAPAGGFQSSGNTFGLAGVVVELGRPGL